MMENLNIVIAMLLALMVCAIVTPLLIPFLRKQAGQNIREEGPKEHQAKAGTPSMGGIAIVAGILAGGLGVGGRFGKESLIMAVGLLIFAGVGFLDDYLKIIKKENEGLKVKPKFAWQIGGSLLLAIYIGYFSGIGTTVYIPFADVYADFGYFYVPFVTFTLVAMVNAVNLTDGLDGLASGVTAIVSLAFLLIAVHLKETAVAGFFGAVIGGCLGFLIFNRKPALIFMGDTGSLALGGAIATAAVVMRMELFLPIIGLIYVLEALSVCLQVFYFKKTGGKRLFKMAPLHHHFELSGMSEWQVVLAFWAFTALTGALGFLLAP